MKHESAAPDQRWSSWSYVFISIQFGCVTDWKSENSGKKLTAGRPETMQVKRRPHSRAADKLPDLQRPDAFLLFCSFQQRACTSRLPKYYFNQTHMLNLTTSCDCNTYLSNYTSYIVQMCTGTDRTCKHRKHATASEYLVIMILVFGWCLS